MFALALRLAPRLDHCKLASRGGDVAGQGVKGGKAAAPKLESEQEVFKTWERSSLDMTSHYEHESNSGKTIVEMLKVQDGP